MSISSHLLDWLSLSLRWFHVMAGIMWIGNSFYFMWLDGSFRPPAVDPHRRDPGIDGESWMVHGGYFYRVEKRIMRAGEMPAVVHWFKWEATFTWLSGMALLAVVYYAGGASLLVDPGILSLTPAQAVALSLSILASSWLLYDALWKSSFARLREGSLATLASVGLATGLVLLLTRVFGGRAAYIHLGAAFGTIMILNVWMRILPAQRKMIDATFRGESPDLALGKAAKKRSTHNSYLTLPVIFVMISNHFPSLYSHRFSAIILLLFVIVGMGIRHEMICRARGTRAPWVYAPVLGAIAALVFLTSPSAVRSTSPTASSTAAATERVPFSAVRGVIGRRCVSCHSRTPTDDAFTAAPAQVFFDEDSQITSLALRIRARSVDAETMPFGNKTGMTPGERALLRAWLDQGGGAGSVSASP